MPTRLCFVFSWRKAAVDALLACIGKHCRCAKGLAHFLRVSAFGFGIAVFEQCHCYRLCGFLLSAFKEAAVFLYHKLTASIDTAAVLLALMDVCPTGVIYRWLPCPARACRQGLHFTESLTMASVSLMIPSMKPRSEIFPYCSQRERSLPFGGKRRAFESVRQYLLK